MSKEIKMSDYFCLPVLHDVYMQDEFAPVYAADCNRVVFKGWNEPALELACMAINNHDRLVEENKRLRGFLESLQHRLMAIHNISGGCEIDARWLAIGKTDIQKGTMAWVRAIEQPES